jgi:hypothetical protein
MNFQYLKFQIPIVESIGIWNFYIKNFTKSRKQNNYFLFCNLMSLAYFKYEKKP